jgi:hypothetical protein
VETLYPTARLVPGNKLADRAAIWLAIAPVVLASATERVMELLPAIDPEAQTASEAEMFRALAGETGMPSEEVPGVPRVTTDRAHAPAAAVAPPAWALVVVEVEACAAAEAVDADKQG